MADTYGVPRKTITGQRWGATSTAALTPSRTFFKEEMTIREKNGHAEMKKRRSGHAGMETQESGSRRWPQTSNRRLSGTPRGSAYTGVTQRAVARQRAPRPSTAVGGMSSTAKPVAGAGKGRHAPAARSTPSTWSPVRLGHGVASMGSTLGVGRAAGFSGGNGNGNDGRAGDGGEHLRGGHRYDNAVRDLFSRRDADASETGDAACVRAGSRRGVLRPQTAFFAIPGARRRSSVYLI
eukprot:jgi/Undpi1/915/HiC_scaffold_10.g04379.m1